jgi:hypothetical protein
MVVDTAMCKFSYYPVDSIDAAVEKSIFLIPAPRTSLILLPSCSRGALLRGVLEVGQDAEPTAKQ